jgi:hypothetical protein
LSAPGKTALPDAGVAGPLAPGRRAVSFPKLRFRSRAVPGQGSGVYFRGIPNQEAEMHEFLSIIFFESRLGAARRRLPGIRAVERRAPVPAPEPRERLLSRIAPGLFRP